MSNVNQKEAIEIEVKEAIGSVQNIRSTVEKAEDINGVEATAIYKGLEMYINKFKLNLNTIGAESMVGNKDATLRHCNSVITALESRLDTLNVI